MITPAVIVALLAGLLPARQAPTASAAGLQWEPIAYEHAGGMEPAERATLVVPALHGRLDAGTIELAVVRFPARTQNPGPPTIYLAGGPGSSGIEAGRRARFPLFMALRDRGDVILFDQRGAGYSRPNLGCRERWEFDPAVARTWAGVLEIARARIAACVRTLRGQGVDLSAFNTRESASDVESLRAALGVPRVNLLAISYGTHLALATMRQHGSSINRVVLAGVVGPNHVLKLPANLDRTFERFSAEVQSSAVATAVPLTAALRQVIEQLEKAPAQVTIQRNGQPVTVTLSPFDVRILLAVTMEKRDTMRSVPALISAMAAGNYALAAAQIAGVSQAPIPTVMNLAMECASGGTAARRAQIAREEQTSLVGRLVDFPQPDVCDLVGAEDLGDGYRSPVRSGIPTLLISGELDSRTPPSNADEVRAELTNATHLVIARAGHDDDLLVSSPVLTGSIVSFLAGQPVADGRLELAPIPFAAPRQ